MYEGPEFIPNATAIRAISQSLARHSDLNGRMMWFAELFVYWELRSHPQRTHDPSAASLFVVPALPHVDPGSVDRVAAALALEPAWLRRRGADHLVACTHWQCAGLLGKLFWMVALRGLTVSLERNVKWLDPRVPHWIHNQTERAPFDPAVDRGLCLDRVIVVPYPPHAGLMRPCGSAPAYRPWHQRRVNVSFFGTIRQREGLNDSSGGVRAALGRLARAPRAVTGGEELERRGVHVRLSSVREFDQSRRCGPELAKRCRRVEVRRYAHEMRDSIFCLHLRGDTSTSRRLYDSVAAGCIPIIVSDLLGPNLPFVFAAEEPPMRPPRVSYELWSIRIRESDFVADPLAAIDAVLSRFLRPRADDVPLVAKMQAAMRRDASKVVFCHGSHGTHGDAGWHGRRLADLLLGEAFARLRDTCGSSQCSGRLGSAAYGDERIRNAEHRFEYGDCLGQPTVASRWAGLGPRTGGGGMRRMSVSEHSLDKVLSIL
ncbi:hypothetical protein EMIHUDRAFT_243671 [Emiliania huxleyi CCMP1516]|jgi:hypothetical protein|uniref:Exostosin GT47 domain-containing protein n=3 Tax=Emiliania huxleyi TaxID=2903 RepID=A0A0D3J536_EMIH1|nr:hypothetical protein EMIHUDRAFT_243671 [Emiliania huxleyi CCMP1516]EOD18621.1 hypothetical protein EMIHUDRAFT_243671 [Emiliania huxleyi CCMP1516]|eukprot:XP_005771050.1 hypothetical protein EMIHUDRAFT_243671 [Emiliania huxleyi CCMP1516]